MKQQLFYFLFFLSTVMNSFAMDKQAVLTNAMRSKKEASLSTLPEIHEVVRFIKPNADHPCRDSWLNRCLEAHPLALKKALSKPSEFSHDQIVSAIEYITTEPSYPNSKIWLSRCTSALRVLEHTEHEKEFTELLQLELVNSDPERWQTLKRLLPAIGAFLSVNEQLREELFNCVCDIENIETETIEEQDITYETWVHVLENYKKEHSETLEDQDETNDLETNFQEIIEESKFNHDGQEEATMKEDEEDALVFLEKPNKPKKQKSAAAKKSKPLKSSKAKNKKSKKKNTQGGKKQPKKNKHEQEELRSAIKRDFCHALLSGNEPKVKELAAKYPFIIDIDMREEALNNKTPLQRAVLAGQLTLCKTLLALGAKPTKTCSLVWEKQQLEEIPSLGIAILYGNPAIAALLLQNGADANQAIYGDPSTGEKEHVLCFAASARRSNNKRYTPEIEEQMIRVLLKAGAKAPCKQLQILDLARKKSWPVPFSKKTTSNMPTILEKSSTIECIEDTIVLLADSSELPGLLKNEEADPEKLTDKYIQALLSKAIDDNDEDKAKLVIEGITDPRALTTTTEDSIGMLHRCVINHQAELCSLLLSHRADPNAVVTIHLEEDDGTNFTPLDVTPLMLGIVHTVPDVVELLLKHKADPNCYILQKSGEGEYPLCVAVEACQSSENERVIMSKKIIADLIKAGATKFEGSIILYNATMGTVNDLDLEDKDDYELVVTLLDLHDVNTLLECKKGVLIFNISVDLAPGEDDDESN